MLSIIFFAILIGISILMVGKPAKGLVQSLELINEVILKMVTIYNDPDAGSKDILDGHIDENSERDSSEVFSDGIMGSEYDDVNHRS
ncbi:dicarboxylate/amino acid:cation symporter [Psychrobacter frigidicola]|uniref:dicarboxylate/amino acid:cation symporter n=1 Tax=Psychrobacter frigidicola TaxID=45611 RepID=UPI001D1119B0|nr:dicarboxylate/amino acid:cation symporter [Psychrobacter frigidicola]